MPQTQDIEESWHKLKEIEYLATEKASKKFWMTPEGIPKKKIHEKEPPKVQGD